MSVSAIVVLGGGRFPDGRLTDLSIQRLDAAIVLYKQQPELKIVVLGGRASTYLPNAILYDATGAEARAGYLLSKGIPSEDILKINDGKDTIGEAIACSKELDNLEIEEFYLVTSEIHMPRAMWVFKKFMRLDYKIYPYEVDCHGLLLEEEEAKYLEATRKYFELKKDLMKDLDNWHGRNTELYEEFKAIHDLFHPKGKESQAYCAVKSE